ncbi:hypothetical protein C7I85_22420 [Mesorhizobium soli]|uniref:Outer membrane lipoprotein carrier protein LolA n=2 Tax=Pseudaminobacter soli (ex Li et al. 2025) TaxID=1295366 RepID=A0A2P7S4G1_9HYPH|nr:hypothetical protein C7I85_22420 [Mesorhizobium soli]
MWLSGVRMARSQEEIEAPEDDVMGPVSARYRKLASYSDQGTVEVRYQWPGNPLVTERHSFRTLFRAPRNFFFRFDADPAAGGDALVIWCDGGAFQSWWKATGVHTVHDGGKGAVAFLTAQSPTKDSANLIAPHLFPQAKLPGPTYGLIEPRENGDDELAGRRCRKIVADQRVTGVVTVEKRPTTVWIDQDSGLVRKVVVDAEVNSPAGMIDQRIFLIEPVVDPELSDDQFIFAPPGSAP